MSFLYSSRPYSIASKQQAIKKLLQNTVPDRDFYLLIFGSVALAICALFLDSSAILIASMIVAPLAYPILSLGLGCIVADFRLIRQSLIMLLLALVLATLCSFLATVFFGHIRVNPVLLSFNSNLYLATIVAFIAGFIAAYGLIRSKVASTMTGIGIAVSLMPPLVATGIALADIDFNRATQTFALFFLNVVGIMLASMLVFYLFKFRQHYVK